MSLAGVAARHREPAPRREARSGGRVPAVEVLVATGRVFDKIVNADETHEIEQIIADGEYYGMQTFDQSLLGALQERRRSTCARRSRRRRRPHDLRLMIEQHTMAGRGGGDRADRSGRGPRDASVVSRPWRATMGGCDRTFPPRLARFFEPDSPLQQLAAAPRARRAPARISSAAACATRCSTATSSTSTSTRDRRPSRRDRGRCCAAGPTRSGCRASASARSACEKDGERFEITTFRADVYRPDSRKPEVTFSDDIETDLSRRDFTVNAMALALDDPTATAAARRSVRRARRSRGAPAAHAARAGDLVRRRPAADAARRALRRDARLRARRRRSSPRSSRCATGSRS